MDQQNIDRLFREKLDQLEVTPSTDTWSIVETQIRHKKRPVVYWVAASVSLLLLSWIVWPKAGINETFTPIASDVSYPAQSNLPQIKFSLPVVEKKERTEAVDSKLIKKETIQFAIRKEENSPQHMQINEDVTELPEPETKTTVADAKIEIPGVINEPLKEEVKPTFRTVKITYIASSSTKPVHEAEKSDSTGVFKKVFAFADKIDPGDMLADIKTAKDKLLNGGLKSKKDGDSI